MSENIREEIKKELNLLEHMIQIEEEKEKIQEQKQKLDRLLEKYVKRI